MVDITAGVKSLNAADEEIVVQQTCCRIGWRYTILGS
jgi:hypothetical protein